MQGFLGPQGPSLARLLRGAPLARPPASRQLIIEVSGLTQETMTTRAFRDSLWAQLGSAKHIPLPSL